MSVAFGGFWKTSLMGLCAGLGPMVLVVCFLVILLLGLSYLTPRDCAFRTVRGRFLFTLFCAAAVVVLGIPAGGEFIYFQF